MEEKLGMYMKQKLLQKKHQLELYAGQLEGMSPVRKLSQGYSYVSDDAGKAINDVNMVKKGDHITIHMLNGKVRAEVTETEAFSWENRIRQQNRSNP